MKLTLKQIEAFIWVCDLGSFRRAAERLNTTQPNISSRISALEDVLGTRLMERDAGSVRILPKGREVLLHAREVLRATEALIVAGGKANLTDGILKLGVTELVVNTWLREFMRTAKRELPNVSIELTVDLSVRISEALLDHSLDLALQTGPFTDAIEKTVPLGSSAYVWVATSKIAASLKGVSPSQLLKFPILSHARGTTAVDEVEQHFARRGHGRLTLVPSNNMSACLHMAIDGLGIAILPEAMVRGDIKAGRLKTISYSWVPKPLKMSARYHALHAPAYVGNIAKLAQQVARRFESQQ
jgi:DNA-binding transcriptional LysR family regulator